MTDLNVLNDTVEKLLLSGKTFGEIMEQMKNNGYSQDETWGAIIAFDEKYRLHPSTTVTD
ncbi:MAG: hypothetical protein HDT24_08690 [Ruminococcus sp.]|nr:hypothetical protein [Ruminococcus sp.]